MLPDHDTNKPENLGAFSYYIEILGILSQVHKFLKQPVDISALGDVEQWQMRYKELDQLLTGWKFGLPGEYGNMAKLFQPGSAKSLTSAWVMLHATYHTAVIRLHSSAAYPTTRSPIFTPSYSASQRCHGAVENIAALGEFAVQHGMLSKLGPPLRVHPLGRRPSAPRPRLHRRAQAEPADRVPSRHAKGDGTLVARRRPVL